MSCFDVFFQFCLLTSLHSLGTICGVHMGASLWPWQGRGSFQAAAPHQRHSHLPDLFKDQLSQHCQLHPSCAVAESSSLVGLAEGQLDTTPGSKFWYFFVSLIQLEEPGPGSCTNANDQLDDTAHILYHRYQTSWYSLCFPDGLGTLPRRLPMRSPSPVDVGRTPQGKSQKEQLKHRHRTVEGYLKSVRKLKLYTVSDEYDWLFVYIRIR